MPSSANRLKPLTDYIKNYQKSVVKEMQSRLRGYDKASGKLARTIKPVYEITGKGLNIKLGYELEDYWPYVDKGVSGTEKKVGTTFTDDKGKSRKFAFKYDRPSRKHVKALQKWGKMKGIPKDKAYAVGVKVKRDGIRPTQFYSTSVNRRRKQFEDKTEELIFQILVG